MDFQKLSLGQLPGSAAGAGSWYNRVVHRVFERNLTSEIFNPSLISAQLLNSDAVVTGGSNDQSGDSLNHISTAVPRRMCGDWSPKLKLLRYVTKMPALLFHFASDYSHQSGGFKAKVYIENGESIHLF